MSGYAVRIHEVTADIRERLLEFVKKVDGSYVFVRETDANRSHYQGWVRCDMKQQTFRVRLKKMFPDCVGNKGYSVSNIRDFEAYSTYILKGTREELPDVLCYSGIELTEQTIADAHRAYWSKAEKPSKSNKAIVEEVTDWALAQGWEGDMYQRQWDVAKQVCDTIVGKKKPLNMFYARGVFNSVMYRLDSGFSKGFISELLEKK